MAELSACRCPVGVAQRDPSSGAPRRRFRWMMAIAIALGVYGARPADGQFSGPAFPALPIGGVPIVLAESGREALVLPLGASVLGLAAYDIATAAASARSVNGLRSDNFKSQGTAVGLSVAATLVPIAVGLTRQTPHSELLVVGGIVLGPSVGHIYAGRPGRGVLTAGLRAGLGYLALLSVFAY